LLYVFKMNSFCPNLLFDKLRRGFSKENCNYK